MSRNVSSRHRCPGWYKIRKNVIFEQFEKEWLWKQHAMHHVGTWARQYGAKH